MRRLWPQSLAAQLTVLTITALIVAQTAGFFLFSAERGIAYRTAQRAEAMERTERLADLLPDLPEPIRADVIAAAGSLSITFALGDAPLMPLGPGQTQGEIITSVPGHGDAPLGLSGLRDWAISMGLAPAELQLSRQLSDTRWLNVTARLTRPGARLPPNILASTLLTIFVLIIAIRAGLTQITRPLRQLTKAADAFGVDQTPPSLSEDGPHEVTVLADALRRMHVRQTGLMSERIRLLAALGHDLRTPITALRLEAECIDDDETRGRMVSILEEMQSMTDSTLAYARGVASSQPYESADPFALVAELAHELDHPDTPITVCSLPQAIVPLRRVPLRRALRNLLENAQRYGGRVTVHGHIAQGVAVIVIDDDGPGIPDTDMERVFIPFERLEHSRSRETGGSGLGLTITRDILRAQGGDVVLGNCPTGGLRAQVSLPIHPAKY